MSEQCDRCKSYGEDRRTIWMACLYNMNEFGLPLETVKLWTVAESSVTTTTEPVPWSHVTHHDDGTTTEESGTTVLQVRTANGPADWRNFYTLRVCKRCRAEWLDEVAMWFHAGPKGEDHDADEPPPSIGSGIFVRENGATKEITLEEWNARRGVPAVAS